LVSEPHRGEVWWGEIEGVGRRPFLVMTREAAIEVLNAVLAAPVTRTVRGIPTELSLGNEDGMPVECAVSFDNLRVVPKSHLTERIAVLSVERMDQACASLHVAVDC
jgi:mRNA interferase MazF